STAAITGLCSSMRVHPSGPSPSSAARFPSPRATAFKSAPAQKYALLPVRSATDSRSSASKRLNDSASAAAVSRSTALRTSGRSIVTVAIAPSVSYLTTLMSVSLFHDMIEIFGQPVTDLAVPSPLGHALGDPGDDSRAPVTQRDHR